MIKGISCAIVGGVVGAAIWAAVGYSTHRELGILAWGVGLLVGFGMNKGVGENADSISGAVAALIALAAIGAGKFATVHFAVSQALNTSTSAYTLQDAKMCMIEQVTAEYQKNNSKMTWPSGMNEDSAEEEKDYPPEVLKDVSARWNGMDAQAQEAYRVSAKKTRDAKLQELQGTLSASLFKNSFSLFDALWAFFAVGSAYRLGSGSSGD